MLGLETQVKAIEILKLKRSNLPRKEMKSLKRFLIKSRPRCFILLVIKRKGEVRKPDHQLEAKLVTNRSKVLLQILQLKLLETKTFWKCRPILMKKLPKTPILLQFVFNQLKTWLFLVTWFKVLKMTKNSKFIKKHHLQKHPIPDEQD